MKKTLFVSFSVFVSILFFGVTTAFSATAPDLGTATNFATLGTAVTLTTSVVTGDVGSTVAGGVTQTGGTVTGATYLVGAEPAVLTAYADFLSAYGDVETMMVDTVTTGTLAGVTLTPGVYSFDTSAKTGTLTLDALGNPDAVWIFKTAVATGYLAATNLNVVFLGAVGSASNVFWWTDAYAAVTDSGFQGTILSGGYVTVTGGTLTGRALATADVTVTTSSTVTIPVSAPTTGPVFIDTNGDHILNVGELFFNTIQAAIDDPSSDDLGNTIAVTPGTYNQDEANGYDPVCNRWCRNF